MDQAGDETSSTCYGRNVRVHANGFEVECYLPSGEKPALSGTSTSVPNVTNLAAKLFALESPLTPEGAVNLILDGITKTDDSRSGPINPKRSVELLKHSMTR